MTSIENNTSSTKNIKGNGEGDGGKYAVRGYCGDWGKFQKTFNNITEARVCYDNIKKGGRYSAIELDDITNEDEPEMIEHEEEEEEDDDAGGEGEMYEVRAFGNDDKYVFESETFNNITEARVCYENIKKEISNKGWGDAEIMLDDITDPEEIVCVRAWNDDFGSAEEEEEEDDEDEEEEEEK